MFLLAALLVTFHAQSPPDTVPHIMISYNWGVQPLVLKLAAVLKAAGCTVWLDVERMAGSTLEASE